MRGIGNEDGDRDGGEMESQDPCEHAKESGEAEYFQCFKDTISNHLDDLEGHFDTILELLGHL